MAKVITVLGGNGYIGRRCIQLLLKSVKDVKVYAVCRSGVMQNFGNEMDNRVEIIKGDCLYPGTFEDIIKKSFGIIHSIGVLFTNDNKNYHMMNKETCLRVAEIANDPLRTHKTNFVYISAMRGIPFPLSLKYGGYLESKRECEKKLLNDFPNINPIILRSGFVKSDEKKWTIPLYYGVNASEAIERRVIQKIIPNLGEKLQLPSSGIERDTLAHFAIAGALGKLEPRQIYSNDYLNDKKNKRELN